MFDVLYLPVRSNMAAPASAPLTNTLIVDPQWEEDPDLRYEAVVRGSPRMLLQLRVRRTDHKLRISSSRTRHGSRI
jgi:hypothetical protein